MNSGIYMWTSPSGKSYIGQSVDLTKRKNRFLNLDHTYGGHKIDCARKKYNHKSLWDYKVLEYCDVDKLDEREKYYIGLYNTVNYGYNLQDGGTFYKIVSNETRKLMSIKAKNRPPITDATRKKMSIASRGRKWDDERKKKQSERMHLRIVSDETKKKLSELNKGKKLNKSSCEKMSKSRMGKLNWRSKTVIQKDLYGNIISIFESTNIAGKATGVNQSKISLVCNGKRKTAGGFIWEYKKEDD